MKEKMIAVPVSSVYKINGVCHYFRHYFHKMAKKLNCWEFKMCGREPGGAKVEELGICPATADSSADGLNNGKNAGRICWAVAGTFCGGNVQGLFAEKQLSCAKCSFYNAVKDEEGKQFKILKPGQGYRPRKY